MGSSDWPSLLKECSPPHSSWRIRLVNLLVLYYLIAHADIFFLFLSRSQGDNFRINVINQLTNHTMLKSTSIVSLPHVKISLRELRAMYV